MEIRVRLGGAAEAERLKTALYRFQEVRNFGPCQTPRVRVVAEPAGLISLVDLGSEAAAEDFRRFWAGFRAEPFVNRGFQDF